MIKVVDMRIPDVKIIVTKKFGDHRGFFSETYNKSALAEVGIRMDFVQDNHSLSGPRGTIRGLHYQSPPYAQDKLVRVVRGSVFDVAVDLRRSSPTFGQHITAIINAEQWNQILIPIGFAHGFCTLEPDTEVIYKVTKYYAPDHDHGVLWNDADLGIKWPISVAEAVLSDKDRRQPRFSQITVFFE